MKLEKKDLMVLIAVFEDPPPPKTLPSPPTIEIISPDEPPSPSLVVTPDLSAVTTLFCEDLSLVTIVRVILLKELKFVEIFVVTAVLEAVNFVFVV